MSLHDERFSSGTGPRTWRGFMVYVCIGLFLTGAIKIQNPYNTPAWSGAYALLMLAAAIVGAWRTYRNWQIEKQSDL
jgi:hypothetical protein